MGLGDDPVTEEYFRARFGPEKPAQPTCQVTMGERGNYFKCGKPAKFVTVGSKPPGPLFCCGLHARHRETKSI